MHFPAQTWLPSFNFENIFKLRTASCLSASLAPSQNITAMKSSQMRQKLRQNIQTRIVQAISRKFTIRWTVACRYRTPKRSCTATATRFGAYVMNSYKTKRHLETRFQQRFPVADIQICFSSNCYAHGSLTMTAATMLCCGSQCCKMWTSMRISQRAYSSTLLPLFQPQKSYKWNTSSTYIT